MLHPWSELFKIYKNLILVSTSHLSIISQSLVSKRVSKVYEVCIQNCIWVCPVSKESKVLQRKTIYKSSKSFEHFIMFHVLVSIMSTVFLLSRIGDPHRWKGDKSLSNGYQIIVEQEQQIRELKPNVQPLLTETTGHQVSPKKERKNLE